MKALVKMAAEPGLRFEDVPVPVLGRDDVLIRVLRTGVCGTDLHIYDWDGRRRMCLCRLLSVMSSLVRSWISGPMCMSSARVAW